MHSLSSSTQREALVNCTNTATEPIHNNPKPPTPPVQALFKRSRPADNGSARSKRFKFSIGESRTGENERRADSADESEEDSDSSSITYSCTAPRKGTIFQAKNVLAMSRPGVTCRPLPCEHSILSWHHLVIDNRSADPLTSLRLRIFSQVRRIHVQFGQSGLVLDTTIRLCIHQWYVSLLETWGCRTAKTNNCR